MATSAELLTLVEAAIAARLEGRPIDSYRTPEGLDVKYMDLEQLFGLRDKLTATVGQEAARANVPGMRYSDLRGYSP